MRSFPHMLGFLVATLLAVQASAQVPIDETNTWDAGTTAGWTNGNARTGVANTNNALTFTHLKQSIPTYAEDIVRGDILPGILLTNVSFRFRSGHVTPSAIRLVLHAWSVDRQWYAPLPAPSAGESQHFSVPVDYSAAKWIAGPLYGAENFENDMKLVDWVGLYVRRHVDIAQQKYEIDDFRIQGLYTEDLDEDGIPNTWEIDHGFDPEDLADGNGNADGDRMSNFAEYRAGTNPRDITSFFRVFIENNNGEPNAVKLRWSSISNRTYRVWASDGSVTGLTPLASGIAATPTNNTFALPTNAPPDTGFYRIEVE